MEHKQLAINLFNETWDLLDQQKRTDAEDALLIHKAHASLYHWLQVGKPIHFQRGEWMVSHVYAVLGMSESALYHAKRCLALTEENHIEDFDQCFAYEAMARAYRIDDNPLAKDYLNRAYASLSQIEKEEDRSYAKTNLDELERALKD